MPRPASSAACAILSMLTLISASSRVAEAQKKGTPAASQPTIDTTRLNRLHFRFIGPEGNRVTSVSGVVGDPQTYYAGAASGGLWKTTDGGTHWAAIFDDQPVSSIGSVSVAASDPNVVWVGTGEPFIRSNISAGWGMWKSTDAGKTWQRAGLEQTGRIARIAIDPHDPNRVLVAALGFAYGPQTERGIYRTTDGGATWTRVLFVNDSTGAVDVLLDPNNARIVYAAFWQIEIHTWGRVSGGAGSSLWKSTDGGTTWTRLLGHGLPERPYGKIGLGVTKANSNRIYAEIETGDGVPWRGGVTEKGHLWRSDDAGSTWKMVNEDHRLGGRTAYYNRMGVTPDNPDEAYFLAADWTKTLDGGHTMIDPPLEQTPGGDHHDIWFDPENGNRFIVSHDDGIAITNDRGRSWRRITLPIAQMYHVTVDTRIPYFVYGNRQDGPSAMGPSNPKLFSLYGFDLGIPSGLWRTVGGSESGWATPDPVDTNLVWSSGAGFGSGGGIVSRYDVRTNVQHQFEVWPEMTVGHPADSLKYRFVWTFPLTISPHDHNTVYVGSQYVLATQDGGQSWRELSPDLTRNDKSRQRISGGLTPDNIGVEYAGVVFAIAESPITKGELWAGSNDGLLHVSRDGGKTWTNLTANLPRGYPEWGTIANIEPSRFAAGTAYVTIDGHQVNNRDPWVYKTTDYGKTWTTIGQGIPKSPLSYAHVLREDPVRRGLLYLGTENGLYVSFDDGGRWQPLQNNLPHAPVYWLVVQEHFSDLVVATYGRGFWILDDITPLRTLAPAIAAKPLHLFPPRNAYRFMQVEAPFQSPFNSTTNAGEAPPPGADITFWLATGARDTTHRDSATITITNTAGKVVQTLHSPAYPGLNRVWWDFTGEKSKQARIRVKPQYADWVNVALDGIPAPSLSRLTILEPPGRYTVKVAYGGQEATESLTVLKDPASGGSEEDIRKQTELARAISADLDDAVDQINALELVRGQLAQLRGQSSADDKGAAELSAAADSLDQRAMQVEQDLFNIRATGRGQDANRYPTRLTERLWYLGNGVTASDRAPTAAEHVVATKLHDELAAVKGRVSDLMKKDVPAFNEKLRSRGARAVISGEGL